MVARLFVVPPLNFALTTDLVAVEQAHSQAVYFNTDREVIARNSPLHMLILLKIHAGPSAIVDGSHIYVVANDVIALAVPVLSVVARNSRHRDGVHQGAGFVNDGHCGFTHYGSLFTVGHLYRVKLLASIMIRAARLNEVTTERNQDLAWLA